MRLIFLIKILLAIGCIYLSFRLVFINDTIDKLINEQYNTLHKLRGDPALDTAENRKIYLQKKTEINNQIDSLSEKRYSNWYKFIAIIFGYIAGFLVRDIVSTLFRKERIN